MSKTPAKRINQLCCCCQRVFKGILRQDYCSNVCRQTSYRNRHGQSTVTLFGRKMVCQSCGKSFNAVKKSAKYCSSTCRKTESRNRNKIV